MFYPKPPSHAKLNAVPFPTIVRGIPTHSGPAAFILFIVRAIIIIIITFVFGKKNRLLVDVCSAVYDAFGVG